MLHMPYVGLGFSSSIQPFQMYPVRPVHVFVTTLKSSISVGGKSVWNHLVCTIVIL